MNPLQQRFTDMLHRHAPDFRPRGTRGTVRCLFHEDKTPSLSFDIEKGVFHCFGCGQSGGVKAFALAVGEEWNSTRSDSRVARARRARFQAEQQARTILADRAEEPDKALCAQHRKAFAEVVAAGDLLILFHRRPDLAEEFPDLVARTEREYGEAAFRASILEAQLDGVAVA